MPSRTLFLLSIHEILAGPGDLLPVVVEKRLRPERGAKSPSDRERGWGPASIKKANDYGRNAISVSVRR